jgi:putative DNA primase/helicase
LCHPATPLLQRLADTTETWGSYGEAVMACRLNALDGIGFVFSEHDAFVGFDIDACRDPITGKINEDAQSVVDAIDSYTEISPSGTGVHVILRGQVPQGGRKKGKYEVYDQGRYFTVTGQHLAGTPTSVEERTSALAGVHTQIFGQAATSAPMRSTPVRSRSDEDLLSRASNARNGEKFKALMRGDWEALGIYSSQSSADLALANMLAFYSESDAEQVDRLFRQSGLFRHKWDEPRSSDGRTYGENTISKALNSR